MPGLEPGIHVLAAKKNVDGRDIGERSDAVLRTTMHGHDDALALHGDLQAEAASHQGHDNDDRGGDDPDDGARLEI